MMDDLISRQAIMKEFADFVRRSNNSDFAPTPTWNDAVSLVGSMPSAQPDIIRCEDCKWYGRADKRRFYRGMDCLQKRIDTIVPDRDFCSKAERRTDEND